MFNNVYISCTKCFPAFLLATNYGKKNHLIACINR